MNCNKCGTPILPGENTCRFCGAIGEFSIRKEKPEIIGFDEIEDNYECIDFTLDEDEVSINPEPKEEPVIIGFDETINNDNQSAVNHYDNFGVFSSLAMEADQNKSVVSEPVLTPVVEMENSVVEDKIIEPVQPLEVEATNNVEEVKIPVVNSVIDEPPTAKIPVEEVKRIVESEQETEIIDEIVEEPVKNENNENKEEHIEKVEEKKEEPVMENNEVSKKTSSYKGVCIVLAIFLVVSIVLNCFLLIKNSGASGIVKASESSLVNLKTVYKNYRFSLPYSWIVNGDNEDYLLIHDEKESWAASISLSSALDYDLVSGKEDVISSVFSQYNHAFTSNYVKTVNEKEFQIFKGKYYSHTVYLIINQIDDQTVAATEVKFKGEVDDEIINDILKCLTNVNSVDMEKFSENGFEFQDVTPLLDGIISKEGKGE